MPPCWIVRIIRKPELQIKQINTNNNSTATAQLKPWHTSWNTQRYKESILVLLNKCVQTTKLTSNQTMQGSAKSPPKLNTIRGHQISHLMITKVKYTCSSNYHYWSKGDNHNTNGPGYYYFIFHKCIIRLVVKGFWIWTKNLVCCHFNRHNVKDQQTLNE